MSNYLIHRNTVVLDIDTCKIFNKQFLPYPLISRTNQVDKNMLHSWLRKRAVPLSRRNAEKIYLAAGLARQNTEFELMLRTHALSINDNYWVASDKELNTLNWESVNLYTNKLSNSLCYLAFTGSGPATITENELSPEFTGQGTYAKCFVRDDNGIMICKQGTNDEISAEVITSFICRLLGIPSIEYVYKVVFDKNASVSKIYTNEQISWESAFWFTTFTERAYGKNIYDFAMAHFPNMYYAMIIIDGLVLNEDRHLQNWSIQLSGIDNSILGMAPLYDFNKAFSGDAKSMSQFIQGKNLLSAARDAQDILQLDLINRIIPYVKVLPEKWQEPFYNRVYYITRTKSTQRDCYMT